MTFDTLLFPSYLKKKNQRPNCYQCIDFSIAVNALIFQETDFFFFDNAAVRSSFLWACTRAVLCDVGGFLFVVFRAHVLLYLAT